jgi:proteasome lid subunit RPN8/RPN11
VRGPWAAITPSENADDVVDQLCPAIMQLPRATDRDHGQEYCGLIYSQGGIYYASYASPLGPVILTHSPLPNVARRKRCFAPMEVRDSRGRTSTLADYHSHPWSPSALSQDDRRAKNLRWFIRIQFDTSCRVMKLVPYLHENRPGEVYVREGSQWKLIAHITPEDKASGIMTGVEE